MILAPTLSLSAGSGAAIVRPTFSRDFAGEKTLNNGTGPAITFTRGSQATYFDANGTLQTASNDQPRFDHSGGSSLGLLIEEARTNSIRNSQAGGAVAGTPGTAPTNWVVTGTANGITRQIVGTGSEDGIAYIDIKYSGTPTNTDSLRIGFEPANQIAALNGQAWTSSAYIKLAAGALTNVTVRNALAGFTSAAAFISGQDNSTTITPTSASLKTQRSSATVTFTSASVAYVRSEMLVDYASGQAIDLTLRIAAPQLEQGAFATSYIPTTSAAVTRSADSAVVTPISSFYNASEGTLFAEWNLVNLSGGRSVLVAGNASGGENRLLIQARETTNTTRHMAFIGGVAEVALDFATFVAGTAKSAFAYAAGNYAATRNGASVLTSSHGAVPSMSALRMGAATIDGNEPLNGHIRRIAYYPKRLSNALLQSLTT